MFLVVGLGNPGEKYENTRHNIGFLALKNFQKEMGFGAFEMKKSLFCLQTTGEIEGKKVVLALPQTYMNDSGKAVKKLVEKYLPRQRKSFENLIVVHDEAYFPLGKIKISKNRGGAGHKGVASIIEILAAKNFIRVRVGVGPKPQDITLKDFVLQKFTPPEEKVLKGVFEKTTEILKTILLQGVDKAMQKYNRN